MAKIQIEGFPAEVSEQIEMPDIAELLLYPMFKRADIDLFRKHATDFQKKLLDMTPLRNNTKYATVLSTVTIMDSSKRVVTRGNLEDDKREWHLDGQGERDDLWETRETLHLLLGHTTDTTEFNIKPMEFDVPSHWDRADFKRYINSEQVYRTLVPQKMELGKIHTFTNRHIHRAVPTSGIQFRYTFRVRESYRNEPRISVKEQMPEAFYVNDVSLGNNAVLNVAFGSDHVKIYVPSSFKGFIG